MRKEKGQEISGASTKTIWLTDLIPKKSFKGGSQVIFGSGAVGSKKTKQLTGYKT